jgi:hypothetical protein
MSYYTGQVVSDFMKLVGVEDSKKEALINFTGSDFLSLRAGIISYVEAVYPQEYQNFTESDLGMMLVEIIAYMGSVISLKTDVLANENFLRTAKNRNNVKKLLELIGVKMKGPLAATANASLTFPTIPYTGSQFSIPPVSRNYTVASPEDNASVNYTLYKVTNGILEDPTSDSSIVLTKVESEGGAGKVWKNLIIQEGAYVTEEGAFTTGDSVKTISLLESPVIDGSVEVYINSDIEGLGGAYTQVDSVFFASGGTDKIYEVAYDNDFTATIMFGDDTLGTSPDINSTYLVSYRVGGGTRGNLSTGALSVTTASLGGNAVQATLTNTDLATGGSEAESIEHAKRYGPLTFRRQDRVVTLQDFVAFANNFSSGRGTIGKATAAVRKAYSSANIIDLYVLEKASDLQLKKATIAYKKDLLDAINAKKMLTDEVVVVDGLVRALDFQVTIVIDKELKNIEESIKASVRDKVLDYFKVDNLSFGKSFVLSDITRKLVDVDKVLYIKIDNLDTDISIDYNEIIQLNNLVINVNYA